MFGELTEVKVQTFVMCLFSVVHVVQYIILQYKYTHKFSFGFLFFKMISDTFVCLEA